jgi:hypothetical protein
VVSGLRDAWSGAGVNLVALAALAVMIVVASAVGARRPPMSAGSRCVGN